MLTDVMHLFYILSTWGYSEKLRQITEKCEVDVPKLKTWNPHMDPLVYD